MLPPRLLKLSPIVAVFTVAGLLPGDAGSAGSQTGVVQIDDVAAFASRFGQTC